MKHIHKLDTPLVYLKPQCEEQLCQNQTWWLMSMGKKIINVEFKDNRCLDGKKEENSTSYVIASLLRFFAMLTLFFLWI